MYFKIIRYFDKIYKYRQYKLDLRKAQKITYKYYTYVQNCIILHVKSPMTLT